MTQSTPRRALAASQDQDSRRKWWALTASCIGTFVLLLDVTKVITALPQIEAQLHATAAGTEWVIDAYLLVMSATLLVFGALADMFGHRRIFVLGLAVFTLASFGGGLAGGPGILIAFRAAQGAGGAMIYATSLSLLAQNFHGKQRGTAFGAWGAVTGLATGLGPIIGGALASEFGWRAVLLVNVPIGAIAVVVTLYGVTVDDRARSEKRIDWAGFIIFTLALLGIIYGVIRAGETSWTDAAALGAIISGIVLLAVFIVTEARVAQPMFDLSLLRVPTFTGGLIAAFTMNGSLFALFVIYTSYLHNGLGYDALQTGVRLLLITGMTFTVSTVAGKLSGRIPVRWLIGPGLLIVGIGILLTTGRTATSTWTTLITGFLIAGIGTGLVNPPLASTAVGVVEPHSAGMASGINTTFRMFGQALAIAVYGSILATTLNTDGATRIGYAHALNNVALIAGLVAITGAAFSVILIRTRDFAVNTPAKPAHGAVPDH
ncbi:MAG: MFS transporter [Gordonia sp. (in: high G+C Gram-positive bacteria)]